MNRISGILILFAAAAVAVVAAASESGNRMIERASQFLAGLDPEHVGQMSFDFADEERQNWHFIPRTRQGLSYGELSPAQRRLADRLLATGLSGDGMSKALGIMYLDEILRVREGPNGRFVRDSDGYFFSVFGEPADQGSWGWRLEGHHLALNFTVQDGEVVSTSPAFMGTNPAIVDDGPMTGMEVLAAEQTLARELLALFDAQDLQTVMIDRTFADIVSSTTIPAVPLEPQGLAMGDMSDTQADALMALLRVYIDRMHPELARTEIEEITAAGLDEITFAWAGSAEPGAAHYYRIQGPTFLVEYDNTQNNANHIHSVWRDFDGDFGADVLAEHYAVAHAQ